MLDEIYVLAYVGPDVEPFLRAVESVCDVEIEALVLKIDAKRRLANGDLNDHHLSRPQMLSTMNISRNLSLL